MADVNTGTAGTVRTVATETSFDAVANTSVISWELWLIERTTSNATFHADVNIPASVVVGSSTVWSGVFGFDWRPAGLQSKLIASGTTTVAHNSDGTGSVNVTGSIGSTGTTGAGGPASATQTVPLTTLTVVPGTPTSVAAVRNSDSQVTVSWAQSSASNGQPTSNTVRRKVNGGAWGGETSFAPATSVLLSAAANQKLVYGVKASNAAGASAWSADSTPVFTTPAAPSGATATKSGSDIVIGWANHVAFSEYETVVRHGVIVGGVTTWDGSPLATVAAGATSYTHVSPNASQIHVYRVEAKNLASPYLTSAAVESNSVQLLAAPNAPTLGAVPSFANKAAALPVPWAHNPVDTTAQTAYEFGYSTNGGSSWSSTGKVTSGTGSYSIPASTYAGDVTLTIRVRTWGAATSGGSDGTGASPWSTTKAVTFKTLPVASVVAPANSSTLTQSTLVVVLGFSQAESASFVQATIELYEGATLLEQIVSTTLGGTTFATKVADGGTYTVKATVKDSNGLTSAQVSSAFSVDYTEPVAAVVAVTYLPESGIGQLDLSIPSPSGGEAEAVAVTITRTIDGETETVVEQYPAESSLTILDLTPTIVGDNLYTVRTFSADGATVDVVETLTTDEDEWAFMNAGPDYSQIIRFSGELKPRATPSVDSALFKASSRKRPIGQYAPTGDLTVTGTGEIVTGLGSTAKEVEDFLLIPGRACYRDPTGRRMFGRISGSVSRDSFNLATFTYTVNETS